MVFELYTCRLYAVMHVLFLTYHTFRTVNIGTCVSVKTFVFLFNCKFNKYRGLTGRIHKYKHTRLYDRVIIIIIVYHIIYQVQHGRIVSSRNTISVLVTRAPPPCFRARTSSASTLHVRLAACTMYGIRCGSVQRVRDRGQRFLVSDRGLVSSHRLRTYLL